MRLVGLRIGDCILEWLDVLSGDAANAGDERKESNREEPETRPKQWTATEFAFETGRTPEEYIVELLSVRDGEMRQQKIIAETGWSRSSVSRLLCEMEASGDIVRIRLGTGKVVYLPEAVPEMAQRIEPIAVPHP